VIGGDRGAHRLGLALRLARLQRLDRLAQDRRVAFQRLPQDPHDLLTLLRRELSSCRALRLLNGYENDADQQKPQNNCHIHH
jgi:hypothetical protein